MKSSYLSLFLSLLFLILASGCGDKPVTETNVEPEVSAEVRQSVAKERERAEMIKQREAKETEERVEKLNELISYREKQEQAVERSPKIRRLIFESKSDKWSQILTDHDDEFQRLKKLADQHEHKMVECTICEGDTYLDYCIFCNGHSDGVCSECEGTGEYFIDQVCPACLGTGECFMCSGMTMMMCLFCDDGYVDLALPPHHQTIKFED